MPLSEDPRPEELAVMQRVAGLPINLGALAVVSNIWRASQAMKLRMERTLLREYDLTWASFSTLFIVWVWGPMETREIARSQAVTRATITSTVSGLEERGWCIRSPHTTDRRLVIVELTPAGRALIEEVFPRFNAGETEIAGVLSEAEQQTLARLLRKIISGMNDNGLTP